MPNTWELNGMIEVSFWESASDQHPKQLLSNGKGLFFESIKMFSEEAQAKMEKRQI